MTKQHIVLLISALLILPSCAKKNDPWRDIDYSKVHNRQARENDSGYVQPSILGCVDDDLINCR